MRLKRRGGAKVTEEEQEVPGRDPRTLRSLRTRRRSRV